MIGAPHSLRQATGAADPAIGRYLDASARDPADSFDLASDVWDLQAYATPSALEPTARISFAGFGLLTPYLKWYVLEHCLLAGRSTSVARSVLGAARQAADAIDRLDLVAFDDLAAPDAFRIVWAGLVGTAVGDARRRRAAVWRQEALRPFFRATRREFGVPVVVPPRASFDRPTIALLARNSDRSTPPPVARALVAKLALHRDGLEGLDVLDHHRLCVVVLHLALGRRISELLAAPRDTGPEGPIVRFTAADGTPALGFRFSPRKGGPDDIVYVSPEWEDVVTYATTELIAYGDAVRAEAEPAAADFLILVSSLNHTARRVVVRGWPTREAKGRRPGVRPRATALRYFGLLWWLNGAPTGAPGVMERWRITASGDPDDAPFHFRTHGARHARASALAQDPAVSRLAAMRDLNHNSRDAVSLYQHGLEQQNAELRRKANDGRLMGLGAEWVRTLDTLGQLPGEPHLISTDDRLRTMLAARPELLEFNRVPAGYCTRPQGPSACAEYIQCVEATDGGCAWFATDPSDPRCLVELDVRAGARRRASDQAGSAGNVVLEGKLAVLAARAEQVRDEAVDRAPEAAIARLRAHLAGQGSES